MLSGDAIAQDWCEGLKEGAVYLSELNTPIIAEGTEAAVEKAKTAILDGTTYVFDGPLRDVNGKTVVNEGAFYIENETSSAPSWDHIIEGIHVQS